MNVLTFDIECNTFQKGNPYSRQNELVCLAFKWNDCPTTVTYDRNFAGFAELLEQADIVVGFNLKFDIAWMRKYGYDFSDKRIWDCQLHRFINSYQQAAYPSLNDTCLYYGLETKLDIVATEYWDKGIDTPDIPRDVLTEYAAKDVDLTYQVYLKQRKDFHNDVQARLFSLQCQDLLVLQEMEWNGLPFVSKDAIAAATKNKERLDELENELFKLFDIHGLPINLSSRDHLSALLYGGTVVFEDRILAGVYKTGAKAGQPRYKLLTWEKKFERLVEPLKGSEMAKKGNYATDVDTLKQLKTNKKTSRIMELLKERSKLMKLNGTYLEGLSQQIIDMDWEPDTIHGQFNQCVVVTGRLSSNKPNLQNIPKECKEFIQSCW